MLKLDDLKCLLDDIRDKYYGKDGNFIYNELLRPSQLAQLYVNTYPYMPNVYALMFVNSLGLNLA